MLKKRLGLEAIEERWSSPKKIRRYYKIQSTTLVIPDGCEWIGYRAFKDCTCLEKVVISDGVKRIGSYAFGDCDKLKEVVIPESVEIIESDAFAWCSKLEKVVIPESVKVIMRGAFRECKNAEITLYKSRWKLNIGESAFWNCKCVRHVEKETRD